MEGISLGKGKMLSANASILKRVMAFIADLLIINLIILYPFSGIFEALLPTGSFSELMDFLLNNSGYTHILIFAAFLVAAIMILYFMIFEKKLNQTPGKMLFNLYIESKTKDLKYWQVFVRSVFLIPIFPFILLLVADPIVMLFTKENQRLSEILSRTKVVEKYDLKY
jgi:uncharacterized RDD family membrane protein YckC